MNYLSMHALQQLIAASEWPLAREVLAIDSLWQEADILMARQRCVSLIQTLKMRVSEYDEVGYQLQDLDLVIEQLSKSRMDRVQMGLLHAGFADFCVLLSDDQERVVGIFSITPPLTSRSAEAT